MGISYVYSYFLIPLPNSRTYVMLWFAWWIFFGAKCLGVSRLRNTGVLLDGRTEGL